MVEANKQPPIYKLAQVRQIYGGRTVLNIEQLTIQTGEVLAIVGPSGAGKSTLLRLLGFLEMPASGSLSYLQQPRSDQWPDLAARRQVTMVFQRAQLLGRSVYQNIIYGLQLRGLGNDHHPAAVQATIDQLGLSNLVNAPAHTLSGGEMQRVALARSLVLQPKVLLLDEPTANLDPYNIGLIEGIVQQANQEQGVTVVIVTHNIFQARRLAQRVGLLLNGKLVEVAATHHFFEQPANPQTAAFVLGDLVY